MSASSDLSLYQTAFCPLLRARARSRCVVWASSWSCATSTKARNRRKDLVACDGACDGSLPAHRRFVRPTDPVGCTRVRTSSITWSSVSETDTPGGNPFARLEEIRHDLRTHAHRLHRSRRLRRARGGQSSSVAEPARTASRFATSRRSWRSAAKDSRAGPGIAGSGEGRHRGPESGAREVPRRRRGSHFTGASDLLRDLTVQYRAVYDHLTEGATGLCPPGSVGLQEGLQVEQLATGAREELVETTIAPRAPPDGGARRRWSARNLTGRLERPGSHRQDDRRAGNVRCDMSCRWAMRGFPSIR